MCDACQIVTTGTFNIKSNRNCKITLSLNSWLAHSCYFLTGQKTTSAEHKVRNKKHKCRTQGQKRPAQDKKAFQTHR